MNTPSPSPGSWDKVERITSLCLMVTLLSLIGSRLVFAVWWPMHAFDFVISSIAVLLLTVSFWFAPYRRSWRLWVIGYAAATQIAPMVWREPALLLPLLGGLIPVGILLGSLVALSRKRPPVRPPPAS